MKVFFHSTRKMKVSVIIISYNTRDLTLQSIKSVMNDSSLVQKEIVVVDNNSTDGSVEALTTYCRNKKNVTLIVNNENRGFSKANNQGISVARGHYILLLNSDTIVRKGALKKLVDFADSTDLLGVVGPQLLNNDGSIQPSCFRLPTISRAIKQYWFRTSKELDKYAPTSSKPIEVESVVGAAFLISPEALQQVGQLDERYFFFYEDLDYCRAVNKVGLKVYYLPTVQIYHLHGASGAKLAKKPDQWKRLIPSSKLYHGVIRHYVFNFILWSGQKIYRNN